jgi:signal transduction histidine kinase
MAVQWCAQKWSVSLRQVLHEGCAWQPLTPNNSNQGLSHEAYWLRWTLPQPLVQELWLTLSTRRIEDATMWVLDETGQLVGAPQRLGLRVPMTQRSEAGRLYGALVLPKALPANYTVVVRLWSRTFLDVLLYPYAPAQWIQVTESQLLSMALALGILLFGAASAAVLWGFSRNTMFLFFSLALLAEVGLEMLRAGWVQRYLWPADWAEPVELFPLLSAVALLSFTTYLRDFIPETWRQGGWLIRGFKALLALTLVGQLWAIGVDYVDGTYFYTYTINAVLMVGVFLVGREWWRGHSAAGWMFLGFVLLIAFELLRLAMIAEWIPNLPFVHMAGPWSVVTIVPILLGALLQQNRQLELRAVQAQAVAASKGEFLAHMSHELRGPISQLVSNARWLIRQHQPQHQQAGLLALEQSSKSLLSMVDELLDHAKGEVNKLELALSPVSLPHFLRQLQYAGQQLAQAHGNRFEVKCANSGGTYLLDERRLNQVLLNLLTNAARHTHNGQIIAELRLLAGDPPFVRMQWSLQDTGAGLAPSEVKRLFEPFVRGTNTQQDPASGHGLGLTVSRMLVRAMGGDLTVVSTLGKGSVFHFDVLAQPVAGDDVRFEHLPSPEVMRQLRTWVEGGQITEIMDWATYESESGGCVDFAKQIHTAAKQLDISRLRSLMN